METVPIEAHERFSGEITPHSSEALVAKMHEHADEGVKRVVMDIATPGGEVSSAMTLYETLRATPFELVTRNVGEVASMGNLLFLAGDRRLASPESTFLMHPLALRLGARAFDVNDLCQRREELERARSPLLLECDRGIARLEREERDVRRIFEERTSLTDPQIRALVRESRPFQATRAQNVGIVHEIVPAGRL